MLLMLPHTLTTISCSGAALSDVWPRGHAAGEPSHPHPLPRFSSRDRERATRNYGVRSTDYGPLFIPRIASEAQEDQGPCRNQKVIPYGWLLVFS